MSVPIAVASLILIVVIPPARFVRDDAPASSHHAAISLRPFLHPVLPGPSGPPVAGRTPIEQNGGSTLLSLFGPLSILVLMSFSACRPDRVLCSVVLGARHNFAHGGGARRVFHCIYI